MIALISARLVHSARCLSGQSLRRTSYRILMANVASEIE